MTDVDASTDAAGASDGPGRDETAVLPTRASGPGEEDEDAAVGPGTGESDAGGSGSAGSATDERDDSPTPASDERTRTTTGGSGAGATEPGESGTVLLVEDNPGDVRLTREAFPEDDALRVVPDGEAALAYLRGRGEYADAPRPDVVLLDLNLPGTDGEGVLSAMADEEALAQIPVVVLTSSDDTEDVTRAYDLGANAYVTKPVDPGAFVDAIRAVRTFWLETTTLPPERGGRA